MRNPSFGEFRSLFQINQVCKDENQRRNLTSVNFTSLRIAHEGISQALRNWGWISQPLVKFLQARRSFARLAKLKNFATPCDIFASQKEFHKPKGNFTTPFQPCEIFATLPNLPEILRYFCTDSVRFLPQVILCNYLLSPCIQL